MTGRSDFDLEKIDHDEDVDVCKEALFAYMKSVYDEKCKEMSDEIVNVLQPQIMLRILDTRWMAHLQDMDYLKAGIGLRAYGQLDPLVEYKQEAYDAFKNLTSGIYEDFLRTFMRLQMAQPTSMEPEKSALDNASYNNPEDNLSANHAQAQVRVNGSGNMPKEPPKETVKTGTIVKDKSDPWANVGRNDPCPCGSGKKYKKCHGANK